MKKNLINFTFLLIDVLFLIAIFYLTQYVRIELNSAADLPKFEIYELKRFLFVIIIILAIMFYEKIYTLRYDFWQETYRIFKSLLLAYFIVLALLMLGKVSLEFSRLFITLYFLFAFIFLPIAKRLTKNLLFRVPFFQKKVLVVGDNKQADVLHDEFENNWYLGLKQAKQNYEMVFITSKSLSPEKLNEIIEKYLEQNDEVYVVPFVTGINFANSNIMEYSNIRYNTIQIQNRLLIPRNIWVKNVSDFLFAIVLFPLFLVIHIFIAIAIKMDSRGSVFFKQVRLGKDGNSFVCYKYRTMYENSDKLLKEYLQKHPEEVEYYQKYHKYKNDPRITKIGKFLRVTSLDELAQLINVLRGEMSMVGPRPYMLSESTKLGKYKNIILKVRPGITGLWQVSGRNNLTFKERNELEVWYIKNWSLWTDFIILIKTIKVVFFKIGAK